MSGSAIGPQFDSPELAEKRCTQCGETKPGSEFYVDSTNGGRRAACKQCTKAMQARRAEKGEGSKLRQRVEDEEGRVRCRVCGEFKHPDKMKWYKGKPKCTTICKKCKHRADASSPAGQRRRSAYRKNRLKSDSDLAWSRAWSRAQWIALRQLAANHPDEFKRLFDAAREKTHDEILLGWQIVREHKRRVFGHADEATADQQLVQNQCSTINQ